MKSSVSSRHSRRPHIAVLQGAQLPSHVTPDMVHSDVLYADETVLVGELNARGARAEQLPWKGNGSDWGAYNAAVIRATFDYIDDRDGFLGTLAAMEAAGCRVFNPLEVVRWNSNKRYLLDLARQGVATVPTWVAGRDAPDAIRASLEALGAGEAVLKPAVGAGGAGVHRVAVRDVEQALAPGLLVQPLLESVVAEGEWSFVYIDGAFSHTLRKLPAEGDFRVQEIYGGSLALAEASAADRAAADAIHSKLPPGLLYARLDLARLNGRLVVMELELIEPVLSFDLKPEAASRLADALLARLA